MNQSGAGTAPSCSMSICTASFRELLFGQPAVGDWSLASLGNSPFRHLGNGIGARSTMSRLMVAASIFPIPATPHVLTRLALCSAGVRSSSSPPSQPAIEPQPQPARRTSPSPRGVSTADQCDEPSVVQLRTQDGAPASPNNELYVGRSVWNRQRFVKNPDTSKRVAKPNPPSEWICKDVLELRIVVDDILVESVTYLSPRRGRGPKSLKPRPR